MPGHVAFVSAGEHVEGGVFERVIAPCFENEWEIEDHGFIRYAVTAYT
jgi:hypothetical protein